MDTGVATTSKKLPDEVADKNKPEDDKGIAEEKVFLCKECGLNENFHYFGTKPPFIRPVKFFEKVYVMKDPFAPYGQGLFLLLGSHCSYCDKAVCQSQECSIYYSKRFCMHCAYEHIKEFPEQVAKEIKKPQEN